MALTGGIMSDAPPPLELLDGLVDLVEVSDQDGLARELPNAEVLFVWDFANADIADLIPLAPRLRWVHVAAVGVNAVISQQLIEAGVLLTNSRGVFDGAMAEYVVGQLIAWFKDFPGTAALQQQRRWQHRMTRTLADSRMVVVGTGSIGRRIADTLRFFGADVTLVGRRPGTDPVYGEIRPSSELAAIVAGQDGLILAPPLTPGTRGMVDREVLESLGPNGYLINVGRGPLIVESDLIKVLELQGLAGVALDVFEVEPLPAKSPLWGFREVVVSPHMSGDYVGFDRDLVELFADQLRRRAAGQPLINVVDTGLGYVPS